MLEVFMLMVGHDGRRKRTKPFAVLDAGVQDFLHVGQAGVSHDGAIAESARSPLHAALKPSDNISGRDLVGNFARVEQRVRACDIRGRHFAVLLECATRKTRDRDTSDFSS